MCVDVFSACPAPGEDSQKDSSQILETAVPGGNLHCRGLDSYQYYGPDTSNILQWPWRRFRLRY